MSMSQRLTEIATLLAAAATPELDAAMDKAVSVTVSALSARRPLLIAGNGGSMSDAQHIAGELVARFLKERAGLKAIALGTNLATLTAWSNDYDYPSAYAREVEAYGEEGGVYLGLSTSGNSPNVLAGAEKAKALGMTVIAMTGKGKGDVAGGKLGAMADILLAAPSTCTPRIQEVHLALYHYYCEHVEAGCFPG